MKKSGILHAELNAALSRLGHGHLVFVVDPAMPIPRGVDVVDLAVVHGLPRMTDVLDALLRELAIEDSIAAFEAAVTPVATWLRERGLDSELVPHERLKQILPHAALVVRTGETTPYANVALRCGVSF